MAKVKGSMIFYTKKYIQSNFPDTFYTQLLGEVPTEDAEVIDGVLSSTKFYPLSAYQNLLDFFYTHHGEEGLMRYSKKKADDQLQGMFGLIARMLSRDMIVKRMVKMWKTVYDCGEPILAVNEADKVHLQIKDFDFTDSHLIVTKYYIGRIMELAVRRKAQPDTRKIDSGFYEFIFRFAPK
jgi:hypothetical protein